MNIRPISFFTPKRILPVAAASLVMSAPITTSCTFDNREYSHEVSWFATATGRLSDKDITKINETRQAPKNTVFKKINETKTEYYTDSEGNTKSREVETGGWHYELVNNISGTESGTTTLPEGFTVKKDIFGFVQIVENGTKGIFLGKTNKEEAKSSSKVDFIEAATGLLSDEQVEIINKERVVPEGTIIVKKENGEYDLETNVTGLTTGTRELPEGYEIRKNIMGFIKIVPMDQKSIFLRNKKSPETENKKDISTGEALTKILTDEQINEINRTGQIPEGTAIAKDKRGDYYITSDALGLETGTRTLPKGFEVKKDRLGFAVVVPKGTRSIMIE